VADLLIREALLLVKAFKFPWYTYLYRAGIFKENRDLAHDVKAYRDHCKTFIQKRKAEIIRGITEGKLDEMRGSHDLLFHLLMSQIEK
jgi:hypothetical protein